MNMLVTFSGIVGSGKTINSKKSLRWLRQAGYEPYYLRFRRLGWRTLLRTPAPSPWKERETYASQEPRVEKRRSSMRKPPRRLDTGKRLTLLLTLGYTLRAMQFRLFVFLHHRRHLIVLNRYFYDSFAHFRITTPTERKYLHWLLAVIPQPALPFMLVLRPETAHRRKPFYGVEELRACAGSIMVLQGLVPNLKIVHTDNVGTVDRRVEKCLGEILPQRRKHEHVQEGHS
ncbi:MAG: hypothetical protein ACREOO_30095 [bacterium]